MQVKLRHKQGQSVVVCADHGADLAQCQGGQVESELEDVSRRFRRPLRHPNCEQRAA